MAVSKLTPQSTGMRKRPYHSKVDPNALLSLSLIDLSLIMYHPAIEKQNIQ